MRSSIPGWRKNVGDVMFVESSQHLSTQLITDDSDDDQLNSCHWNTKNQHSTKLGLPADGWWQQILTYAYPHHQHHQIFYSMVTWSCCSSPNHQNVDIWDCNKNFLLWGVVMQVEVGHVRWKYWLKINLGQNAGTCPWYWPSVFCNKSRIEIWTDVMVSWFLIQFFIIVL